jgi:death-on-curing protein
MTNIYTLTEAEILRIRRRLASVDLARKSTFGAVEPMFPDRLASAVARQWTSIGTVPKYTRLSDIGATLFYGVAMSHAFENGNKRTAMMALFVLLDRNGHVMVDTSEDEFYNFAESVADHRINIPNNLQRDVDSELLGISTWIRDRMKPMLTGDRHMRFSELRVYLRALGCTFDKPHSNYIKIHCGTLSYMTGYPHSNFDVAVSEIKRIRRALELDAPHGVDASGFYDLELRVTTFVKQHTNLMSRLANL